MANGRAIDGDRDPVNDRLSGLRNGRRSGQSIQWVVLRQPRSPQVSHRDTPVYTGFTQNSYFGSQGIDRGPAGSSEIDTTPLNALPSRGNTCRKRGTGSARARTIKHEKAASISMKRRIEEEEETMAQEQKQRTLLDQLVEQDRAEFNKSVRKQLDQAEVFQRASEVLRRLATERAEHGKEVAMELLGLAASEAIKAESILEKCEWDQWEAVGRVIRAHLPPSNNKVLHRQLALMLLKPRADWSPQIVKNAMTQASMLVLPKLMSLLTTLYYRLAE